MANLVSILQSFEYFGRPFKRSCSLVVILEKTIRIPRSLSVKAASILKGFLNKNPVDRLGCNRESGFMEIMTHPFFKTIEWELVRQKHFYYLLDKVFDDTKTIITARLPLFYVGIEGLFLWFF